MRIWKGLFFLCIIGAAANSQATASGFCAADLGTQVTIEGTAVNSKIGALLLGDDFKVWIDGLYSWPPQIAVGGSRGKKIRVTGILAEDYCLPVFIPKKGELPVQGIPMPEGTDLEKAKHRCLLKKARWVVIRE
jgi:hypothetical protein